MNSKTSNMLKPKDFFVNEAYLTNQIDLSVKDKNKNKTEENKKEMLTEPNRGKKNKKYQSSF